MKKGIMLVLSVLAAGFSTSATAGTGASHQLTIRGHVPVICRLTFEASAAPVQGNSMELGRLNELCNAPQGYQLVAIHDSGISGASFRVSGLGTKALSTSGRTVLIDSSMPGIAARDIVLNVSSESVQHITFAIEPKGAWF